jgi:nucleotide-binding universal stress UspA family protein
MARSAQMTVKDILVHVDSMPGAEARLQIAVSLASQHSAHLTGLHVKPNPYVPASPDLAALPDSFFDDQQQKTDANAAAAKAKFDTAIRKANIASEWRAVTGYPSDVVRRQARYADLVIVGQHNPGANGQAEDLPDGVLLTTGRPVVVVPYAMPVGSFATNVLIAWDDGAQATRAIHDAIPLMAKGAKVTVMAINPADTGDHGPIPCADICLHLARHGFVAEASSLTAPDANVADVLLARAFEEGYDLLVMGAYGHSRLREFVFGGVTAQVLQNMTLPVLMAH